MFVGFRCKQGQFLGLICPLLALGSQLRAIGEALGRSLPLTRFGDQITGNSHFTNDLGLDSLDEVEVVMAIEEVRDQALFLGKDCHGWNKSPDYSSIGVQH